MPAKFERMRVEIKKNLLKTYGEKEAERRSWPIARAQWKKMNSSRTVEVRRHPRDSYKRSDGTPVSSAVVRRHKRKLEKLQRQIEEQKKRTERDLERLKTEEQEAKVRKISSESEADTMKARANLISALAQQKQAKVEESKQLLAKLNAIGSAISSLDTPRKERVKFEREKEIQKMQIDAKHEDEEKKLQIKLLETEIAFAQKRAEEARRAGEKESERKERKEIEEKRLRLLERNTELKEILAKEDKEIRRGYFEQQQTYAQRAKAQLGKVEEKKPMEKGQKTIA